MIGAIAGDIIGSLYEQHPIKTTRFPLFTRASHYTDDTVLTVAIADAILNHRPYPDALRDYARRYPAAGYGLKFLVWAMFNQPQQHSTGNGAAMKVSPIGWAFDDLDTVLAEAKTSCLPSHDHPQAIRGAQAVAAAVYLARTGSSKRRIKTFIESKFGYDLSTPLKLTRPGYQIDATCQGAVPVALRAFLEGGDFETVVRLAVSMGGDADTLACMAGAVSEAKFGVPGWIRREALVRLDAGLRAVVEEFERRWAV